MLYKLNASSIRNYLFQKTIPYALNQVLKQVIKIVNFNKTRPLKSRFFENICIDMDSQHKCLILHTEARWLSRGKLLCCVHKLHKKLCAFFKTEKHECFCEYLQCEYLQCEF